MTEAHFETTPTGCTVQILALLETFDTIEAAINWVLEMTRELDALAERPGT